MPIKIPKISNNMIPPFIGSAVGLGVLPPLSPCPAAAAGDVNNGLSSRNVIVNR